MKLVSLPTRSLNNEDMFAVSTSSLAICEPLVETFSAPTKIAFTRLNETTTDFGAQLNRNRASEFTKVVNAENKNADKAWKQIKNQLKIIADNPVNEEKANAANELITLLKPYWNVEDLVQNTQIKAFNELFAKYTDEWKPKAALAGIDEMMTYLKGVNGRMEEAWNRRNDIAGDMASTKSATTLRNETVKLYTAFMTLLSHESELIESEEMNAMMADLNALRSKYAALIATRKTIAENKKKDNAM